MAYLKIECSVARNKKFLKAGPAPSWLWVCGLAYCQEGLTDGFIPTEALPHLGVRNATQLASHLVKAGLWDAEADGSGWRVHDYLEHNRSASQVADIKAGNKENGKRGGRPPKNRTGNRSVSDTETAPVAVVASVADAVLDLKETEVFSIDVCAREFLDRYPLDGRCGWNLIERPLHAALHDIASSDGLSLREAWAWLTERLDLHKRSHLWRIKGMVKRADRWLVEGLYRAEPAEAPPVAEQLTAKTNRTLAAAAEVLGTRAS